MSKYNTFLTLFIVAVIAGIFFMGFYIKGIFTFVAHVHQNPNPDPFEMLSTIFSGPVIISLGIALLSSLASRIAGIVLVAKSKAISDGEKAIWIIGFVLMSFITSIVFLIMAKGKKFVE
jgi:hypothetical protein